MLRAIPVSFSMRKTVFACILCFVLITTSQLSFGQLRDFKLVSPGVGWARVQQHLYFTQNNGATWNDITPTKSGLPIGSIDGVTFLDDRNGWVLLRHDSAAEVQLLIAATTDSGRTWRVQAFAGALGDHLLNYSGVAWFEFIDGQHGWLVLRERTSSAFSHGLLFRTNDGGQNWVELPRPPLGDRVRFTSQSIGWMAGGPSGHDLFVSRDAGMHWDSVRLPQPQLIDAEASTYKLPTISDPGVGYILAIYRAAGHKILVRHDTSNNGISWNSGTIIDNLSSDFNFVERGDSPTPVHVLSNGSQSLLYGAETRWSFGLATTPSAVISSADFLDANNGWLSTVSRECESSDTNCQVHEQLLKTSDGGLSFVDIGPPEMADRSQGPALTLNSVDAFAQSLTTGTVKNQMAFDKCSFLDTTTMHNWLSITPYRAVGFYIGGNADGRCRALPDSNWISAVGGFGWGLLPIWVGRQAPNWKFSYVIGATGNPENEGQQEASAAWDRACNQLNLACPTIIYYDLEGVYPRSGGPLVSQFIKGWVEGLHSKGQLAGVYSNHPDFQDISPSALQGVVPDAIWPVFYPASAQPQQCGSPCQTVFNIPDIDTNGVINWTNDQRVRQTGQGIKTALCFAGFNCISNPDPTGFGLDEDWIDGPVAFAAGTVSAAEPTITTSLQISPSGPYIVGQTLTATFTITNKGSGRWDFQKLLAGGRLNNDNSCSGGCPDFTVAPNIGLNPGESFSYQGTQLMTRSGNYHFFTAYLRTDNIWNTAIPTAPGVTNTVDLFVSPNACTLAVQQKQSTEIPASSTCATFVLTVNSLNPANGVGITVSPTDVNGLGNGTTSFTRTYSSGAQVTLTAPTVASGNNFSFWSGCDSVNGVNCTVTMNSARTVTANYSPSTTFSISGQVTFNGSALSGVNVNLTEGAVRSTTTDAAGHYSFAGLTGGVNYLVTPSSSGFTFNPTGHGFNPLLSNQTADFVASLASFTLTVTSSNPASGVTISVSPTDITGSGSGATTFSRNYNSGTTVTLATPPTAGGNSFSFWSGCDSINGTSCTVTMNTTRSVMANYSSSTTFNISGQVTFNGSGLGGVNINLSEGAVGSTTTDAAGHYSFTGLTGGINYLVAPSLPGFTFNPTGHGFNPLLSNQTADFAASIASFTLAVTESGTGSGTITSSDGKINCGATCSAIYNSGSSVTLTAGPSTGSTFGGWSGCDSSSGTSCTVSVRPIHLCKEGNLC